uniref:C2 domain-containing protein n=1 Tax=Fibrocapsa japonica TaxID=94617 RepID=A0A7S2V0G6_9STRA|mmetsp:Transcript_1965/g.2816  ORF Transcript_1965/g.2816 Transcript_1965/m.2816 type:complete len:267 (+) Transcript_1965:113-913(+)
MAGKYIIQALEGKNIKGVDFLGGASDAYLVLKLNGKEVGRTDVKNDSKDPKWNKTITIDVPSGKSNVLVVDCMDQNKMKDDVLIGSAKITLSESKQAAWYPLKTAKNEAVGEVRLAYQFTPAGKKPVTAAEAATSAKKESGFLVFLQEYGWILYILALVGVTVWKFVFASSKARLPIESGLKILPGDYIASTSHALLFKDDCSLELYNGVEPVEGTATWTNGVKASNCKKNSWATLTDEDQLTVFKSKKVYWSSNVADLPEFDGLM